MTSCTLDLFQICGARLTTSALISNVLSPDDTRCVAMQRRCHRGFGASRTDERDGSVARNAAHGDSCAKNHFAASDLNEQSASPAIFVVIYHRKASKTLEIFNAPRGCSWALDRCRESCGHPIASTTTVPLRERSCSLPVICYTRHLNCRPISARSGRIPPTDLVTLGVRHLEHEIQLGGALRSFPVGLRQMRARRLRRPMLMN
jgi:hypothetical protein